MGQDHPLTATHWGVYRAEVEGGRVKALHPFEEDTDPSEIGAGILDALDAPSRITAPMVRESWLNEGPGARTDLRGKDRFVEVTWDKVETLLAAELTRIRQEHGNASIFAGSYGWASAGRFHHAQSQMKRFLNCIGGFTSGRFTYSFAAAEAMIPHVLGSYRAFLNTTTSYRSLAEECELIVAFGGIPVKNGQIESGGLGVHIQREGLRSLQKAGVDFVNISPLRCDMEVELGAEWLPARPNSDVAMMLGLAHTLCVEGLHDTGFLERYCEGFDLFQAYLLGVSDGEPKDAEWAAKRCDIPAGTLRDLARRMARKRTMISVAWALTRQDHGEQPFWMGITLAAMLGQIGLPGGGVGFGYSAANGIGQDYQNLQGASLPQGQNAVPDFIPVARITELLENPGGTIEFDGQSLTLPDIRLVWWAGGNPYHHHQDLNRLAKAWQQPDTIVVNDWCWTATARRADIVLPTTTHLERNDLSMSIRDAYVVSMQKAIAAPDGVRSDHDIFRGLAKRMGIEAEFTGGMDEAQWLKWLYDKTRQSAEAQGLGLPDWAELQERGWARTAPPETPLVMMRDFRDDPQAHRLETPSGKIEIFCQTVADFGYDDCPGHPVWQEPYEWLGNAEADQLHLISNQPAKKLHSQLDQGHVSASGKIDGREPVLLNRADAAARGIADHDLVRLSNARGACLAIAVLSDDIRPGVVQMSTGAWWDPDDSGTCRHGNPNALTRDVGTSALGQGPTAHTCLVSIAREPGPAPAVQAFVPPPIAWRKG